MAVPFIKAAFSLGEVAPSLYGRVDLARFAVGASTFRNGFVSYKGGFYSRAGTKFCGYSRQVDRDWPPRLIPFTFNINQSFALEFGHHYMRVITDGAFVTETAFGITGVAKTNPAELFVNNGEGVSAAVPNNGLVTSSYAPGDQVTLAGGAFVTPGILEVQNTQIAKLQINSGGANFVPGDTLTVTGGTQAVPAVLFVNTVGGGGAITTFSVTNPGSFTANPAGGTLAQNVTSGVGTGASFQFAIMGPNILSVGNTGLYSVFPGNPVAQASTTGTGVGATFNCSPITTPSLVDGDWVFIEGIVGTTELNGRSFVVRSATPTSILLYDVFNVPINGTGFQTYISGGTAARIYTAETPYSEEDLAFLKFTQSADVMSICCVNQDTDFEYQVADLRRVTDTNWVFDFFIANTGVASPTGLTGTASTSGTTFYEYCVTAVNSNIPAESTRSNIAPINNAVDVSATAGTISLSWDPVVGATSYNIYKASPIESAPVPSGVLFGYAGTSNSTQFADSNIVPDFTQVPPVHGDPFTRGAIIGAIPVTAGAGYTTIGITINTTSGSGALLQPVLDASPGGLSSIIILAGGGSYHPSDTITITGDGAGATAHITVGPQTGTYPSTVAYFQQRRVYANTLNRPDTYFMSQPGAYLNFDFRTPTIASDAITGNPWAVQVDGIQFMVNMPGGLVVLTSEQAWQLTGSGGSSLNPQAFTPSTQQAQPQAYNGCDIRVPPIQIDYDIIYVQAKGSIPRDLAYQFYTNIYTGSDLSLNSSHLFQNYQIREWAWAEEPFKVLWAVRNDGILLALTYVKPQEVAGWGRSDTNGRYVSVCSITERPVDAVYLAVQRFPAQIAVGNCYMIERMDNRLWTVREDAWCVDAALRSELPTPDATLTASSATGGGVISGFTLLSGGANYSGATMATIADDNGIGPGAGAIATLNIINGIVTGVFVVNGGANYTYPQLTIFDPAGGTGAVAVPILLNAATFTASGEIFDSSAVGSVIRMGGGVATVTSLTNPTTLVANITSPIVNTRPDDSNTPYPALPGEWSLTTPSSVVNGLQHLQGLTVTGLYDGNVLPPTVVPASGSVALPAPATLVTIGLGFECQVQSLYLDTGNPTSQGQRKKIGEVTVRTEASAGLEVGSNQPDGSTLSPPRIAPPWANMTPLANKARAPYGSTVQPLYTGDSREPVTSGFATLGQVAVRQRNPLPMQILAFISEDLPGDMPEVKEPASQQRGKGGQ